MKPEKLTEDQIQSTLSAAIDDAVSFIESEVAPDRNKAQRYANGECDLKHEEGRSGVVATKCRDSLRAVTPGLMRIFMQSGTPVEFEPSTPAAVLGAEQATKYADYVFRKNGGFDVLSDVFYDALVKKAGIAKICYDETEELEIDEYSGLDEAQMRMVAADPSVEEVEASMEVGPDGVPVYSASAISRKTDGQIKIMSVAPEDFFVDSAATCIDDAYVCGHTTMGRVGDLVEMGFDFEEVYNLGGDTGNDEEADFARKGYDDDENDESANDPSMRKVLITEAYMRMDMEGRGIPQMYKFICGGSKYTILDQELCDYVPFAVFEVDPIPHAFFGNSLVDIIVDDQDASTSMMRGLLDSIAMMNNPRLVAIDGQVNVDDLLNNEIGGIIRAKSLGAIQELTVGAQAANAVLPAMEKFDEAIRAKTGVSGAGQGIDADALQSQTAAGVNAAVQAATAVAELMARILAEGGMKQMFRLIAQIARQHPKKDELIRIDGKFIPVDPRSWSTDMTLIANVGLGTNHHTEKVNALQQTLQMQMQVYSSYGPQNGLVTLTNIRNTWADIMAMSGVHNSDRYVMPMDLDREQQMMQQQAQQAAQQAQAAQGAGDPNAAFLQAEGMKAQAKVQTDMAKLQVQAQQNQSDNALKVAEMQRKDDLERDQMAQDRIIDAAKIAAQYGTAVDTTRIKAEQAAPRGGDFV